MDELLSSAYREILLHDLLLFTFATIVQRYPTEDSKIETVNMILEGWEKRVNTLTKKSTIATVEQLAEDHDLGTVENKDVLSILADVADIPRRTVQKELKRKVRHNFIKTLEEVKRRGGKT